MISKTTFIYLFMFSLYALHQCTYRFLHTLSIAFFSINLEKLEPMERLTLILRRGESHIWILSPGIQIKPKACISYLNDHKMKCNEVFSNPDYLAPRNSSTTKPSPCCCIYTNCLFIFCHC